MKKLGIYGCVLSGLWCASAFAGEKSLFLHCTLSTRLMAGYLSAEIRPDKGFLSFSFDKSHSDNTAHDYRISGTNQDGFGKSPLSSSSVEILKQEMGQTKITAVGTYYDQTEPVGKTEIEIILQKTAYSALGGYRLTSFTLNGAKHNLEGNNHCHFE